MSLILPGNYASASKISAITEDYLIQLYKSGSDDVSIGLAFNDKTVSNQFYHGAILNTPTIRESIDLAKSTAKQSSISLSIANFPISSSDFSLSSELFGSGNYYLNQSAKIFSCLSNASDIDDCLHLDDFRLVDVKHDENKVDLLLVQQRPWDFIDIPSNKSIGTNRYFPVAYGNFTREVSEPIDSGSGPQFCNSASVFPVPVSEVIGDNIKGLLHYGTGFSTASNQRDDTNPTEANLHFYEKNIDVFVPLYPVNETTVPYEQGQAINVSSSLERGFRWNDLEEHDTNEFNTPLYSNYTDTDFSHYSSSTGLMDVGASGEEGDPDEQQVNKRFMVNMKQPDGFVSKVKVHIRYKLQVTEANNHESVAARITDKVGNPYVEITAVTSSIGTLEISHTGSAGGIDPIELIGEVEVSSEQTGDASGQVAINELYVYATIKPNASEPDSHNKRINDLKLLYSGADGMLQSFSGSSAISASRVTEIHRDMLNRFAGYDKTDTQILDWSGSNSARRNWKARYFALKPEPLKKTLDILQYEGGFIFKLRPNGARYITVKDSYSASDADATLTKNDLSRFKLNNSKFGDLLTKRVVRFRKHPARNTYFGNVTATNAATRDTWNIKAKEGIKEIKLKMLVDGAATITSGSVDASAGNPNDNFIRYYDQLFGDIKLEVSGEIVNKRYYGLETGDIVLFDNDNMHLKPFGTNWSNRYFMITTIQRSPGVLNFTAQEVS